MKKSLLVMFFMTVCLFSAFCAKSKSKAKSQPTPEPKTAVFTTDMFNEALSGIETSIEEPFIYQKATVNDTDFNFIIDLTKWNKNTSVEQIIMISKLFWQCYPAMYKRFGEILFSPEDIFLAIEDEGYEVAWNSGNLVHLHDKWLKDNPTDYDCLTHEFAHAIQDEWLEQYLEYDGYIERFADYCRYIYAYNNGYFNDNGWTLWTPENESSRETSVRFLVWLDTFYSTTDNDIIFRYANVARNGHYSRDSWDRAWKKIFKGSALEGKSIDEVWALYTKSDFAWIPSHAEQGEISELRAMLKR